MDLEGLVDEVFLANLGTKWFTYREGFEAFAGTGLATDAGWGCTIRAA